MYKMNRKFLFWHISRSASYPDIIGEQQWHGGAQVYEVNRKLLQEHAAPLMAVYLHGVAVVREELNMDVSKKPVKGEHPGHVMYLCNA